MSTVEHVLLFIAAIPFIYYLLAIYSTIRFFKTSRREITQDANFTPPVSCLKPIKGLDPEAYQNYSSFCKQDYPDYEIVFCVDENDPALPLIERLKREFPERRVRILLGSGRNAINDKVARLVRLTTEAEHDIFVITDGDVRVRPDYLRSVVAPFRDSKVGAATCLYVATKETSLVQELQSIGMMSDFFPAVMVAWKLDGVKFTFGQTIVTRRTCVEGYGGYQAIEDRPADDVYAGRLVAEQGYEVRLLPYVVESVADFHSFAQLIHKRIRWATVQRTMRPWGHIGLVFTWGLPWSVLAVITHPTLLMAVVYLGGWALARTAMTWLIGVWAMKQQGLWKKMLLIPLWDAMAFLIWIASFLRQTIRWREVDYRLQNGKFVNATRPAPQTTTSQ
ncbi:MAG: glycosyltransferase [Candidatus Acidiferrales bacterium]